MGKILQITGENIPFNIMQRSGPQFHIRKWERDGADITLHYEMLGDSPSIPFSDHQQFQEFPKKVVTISGGWYGESGRWKLLTRLEGTLKLTEAEEPTVISKTGKNFRIQLESKGFFTKKLFVTVESEELGILSFKCKSVQPQPYETYFQQLPNENWIGWQELTQIISSTP